MVTATVKLPKDFKKYFKSTEDITQWWKMKLKDS